MCSIFAMFHLPDDEDLDVLRERALCLSRRQCHRGPDWRGVFVDGSVVMVHERLAIVDPASGVQPLRSADGALVLVVNGEIYNHRQLRQETDYPFTTGSDCEVINALYRSGDSHFVSRLNGIFAFALWDANTQHFLIARDPMGVCPLYWGRDSRQRLCVASEMKALSDVCSDVSVFPPGHIYTSVDGILRRYYHKPWRDYALTHGHSPTPLMLRESLELAVKRQLMSDLPYGVLLSGGLDSSLVAACATKFAHDRMADQGGLHSFAIGLKDSPDLAAAQVAAAALGTVHHGFVYSLQEGIDALPEVIYHLETYDITTIRAATPMYLLARRIKAMEIKMVLSGEGSDELFGGYLYFHKAPSAPAFHAETLRKLDALHHYDCLRANKAMMAWGIEARVPFLDLDFIDVTMSMDATWKMISAGKIEKHVLREAFTGVMPAAILWRQKEQFSDGVGYAWIDGLKQHAAQCVSDADLATADTRFPYNTPETKEAYLYRRIFAQYFPSDACAATVPGGKSIACSSPEALAWDASFAVAADPSGRAIQAVHACPIQA